MARSQSISDTDLGYDVAVHSNGKIAVSGEVAVDAVTGFDFGVARYNSNGSLDQSFDTDGKVTTPVANGNLSDASKAVSFASDGKIVAIGFAYNNSGEDFAIVRYNDDGSLDGSFNGNGKKLIEFGEKRAVGEAMAFDRFGRIVVVGTSNSSSPNADFAVARVFSSNVIDWSVTFSGRAVTTGGRGLSGVRLSLTDGQGITRVTQTNPFGYYRFFEVEAGRAFTLSPQSKSYTFSQTLISLQTINDIVDMNFFAEP